MRPETILIPTGCDLKRLPLDASEAFLLSRLDGQLTLEEIGEIAGLGFDKARRLAERLVILGAVKPLHGASVDASVKAPLTTEAEPTSKRRIDPRAESASMTPPPVDTFEPRSISRPKRPSVRPPPEPVKKRRSTKSMKAQRVPPAAPVEERCELDEATQEKINAMDAKIRGLDHYGVLGVARDADKKEIKRAYFALAASFHPDRFFGKKLGPLRATLDRVFMRITDANDALSTKQRRDAYDATLPPAPAPPPKKPSRLMTAATAEPKKKPSRMMAAANAEPKKPSRLMTAVRPSPMPRKMSKRFRRSLLMGAVNPTTTAPPTTPAPEPAPSSASVPSTNDKEKFQRLQAAAKLLASHTRADALVKAAEEAIRAGDIMGAANNYRLALQMHDDPVIKDKLAAIDRHSRDLRYEKYVAKGRAAERAERWEEAADHYIRANEARKEASVAERAAHALHMSHGDLRQATALAEQAVAANGNHAEYRVTLAEILFAANLTVRAREECDRALELAPNHPRAKALKESLRK